MSRSYKHTPYFGDHKGKGKKRAANHVVRMWLKSHPDFLLSGKNYRKLYEPWDICDFWAICSYNRYVNGKPDEDYNYRSWYKAYQMK